MKLSLEHKMAVRISLAIVLVLSVLIGFLLMQKRHREQTAQVAHSYAVQAQIERTLVSLSGSDAQRSPYLFARGKPSLERYRAASEATRKQITALSVLTVDSPVQQQKVLLLWERFTLHANLMETLHRLYDNAPRATPSSAMVKQNLASLIALQDTLYAMDGEEALQLTRSTVAAQNYLQQTNLTVLCIILLVNSLLVGLSLSMRRDVQLKIALERLHRESDQKIGNTLERITDAFFSLDPEWRFTYVNGEAEKMLGRKREDLLGKTFWDIDPAGVGATLEPQYRKVQQEGAATTLETYYPPEARWYELHIYPVEDGLSVYFRDITERKSAEEARIQRLRDHARHEETAQRNQELQNLSRRLVEVQEAERSHIARELHDEIGQILTGLKLSIKAAQRLPDREREIQLEQAQELVNELIRQVRSLSLDLRPAMLDDLGLFPALTWLFERYTEQTGVAVQFDQIGLERRFPPMLETAAYRIVQEALTNIARYAGAKQASVHLHVTKGTFEIQIDDEGCGFVPGEALRAGRSSGLTGMQERAALLGGSCHICSVPGEGTCVQATLPLPDPVIGIGDRLPLSPSPSSLAS